MEKLREEMTEWFIDTNDRLEEAVNSLHRRLAAIEQQRQEDMRALFRKLSDLEFAIHRRR